MKRREMNALAHSLCQFLYSRNNDITGYWGIGMLCANSVKDNRGRFSFRIIPGETIRIYSCELNDSKIVTDKLVKFNLDSIDGRMSFFPDGRYADGAAKYTCGIAIAITQGGRTGMALAHVACWPHDTSREKRRPEAAAASLSFWERMNKRFKRNNFS